MGYTRTNTCTSIIPYLFDPFELLGRVHRRQKKSGGGGDGWGLEGNEYFKILKPNGRIRK